MSTNWDNMDKKVWDSSEVMTEFTKLIMERAAKLRSTAGIISDTEKATTNIQNANQSAKELVQTLSQNLAEDEEDESGISDEEYEDAKNCLIDELTSLSHMAADEKNIKLAYQIERTIYDLEELFEEE